MPECLTASASPLLHYRCCTVTLNRGAMLSRLGALHKKSASWCGVGLERYFVSKLCARISYAGASAGEGVAALQLSKPMARRRKL
jgi:hypothetical protein